MYKCLDCDYEFQLPMEYLDARGTDTPPYEEISCCPECGGNYTEIEED